MATQGGNKETNILSAFPPWYSVRVSAIEHVLFQPGSNINMGSHRASAPEFLNIQGLTTRTHWWDVPHTHISLQRDVATTQAATIYWGIKCTAALPSPQLLKLFLTSMQEDSHFGHLKSNPTRSGQNSVAANHTPFNGHRVNRLLGPPPEQVPPLAPRPPEEWQKQRTTCKAAQRAPQGDHKTNLTKRKPHSWKTTPDLPALRHQIFQLSVWGDQSRTALSRCGVLAWVTVHQQQILTAPWFITRYYAIGSPTELGSIRA